MRKIFMLLVIGLLCATLASAQANTSSQSVQQPPSAQSGTQTQPQQQAPTTQPSDARPDRDRARPDANPGAASTAQADPNAAQSDSAKQAADQNAASQPTQRPASGGVPWGWIVLGIVVVAVILALIGRGTDRVDTSTRVESIDRDRDVIVRDRRDDDIRRAG